ncbi:NAD(P)/FAD-dependent oxidoreductase [Fibrella sp. WM1]|uniref:NAD(P)/FAD-dependent oxidoreductase n=1 Tax=Fibrella musci TaxID=3242485 RepID=UPI0035226C22
MSTSVSHNRPAADVLIVGQGIAGSVLALTLLQRGLRVQVVSSASVPSASLVAAGIVNPLTGRKLVKTWLADQLFPYLHQFYSAADQRLSGGRSGTSFFTPLDVYRPYRDVAEQIAYERAVADPELARYVTTHPDNAQYSAVVSNPFGGLQVTGAGWVDLPRFIAAVRDWLTAQGLFQVADVSASALQIQPDGITYNGQVFRYVIFCEGPHGETNSFFNWLPYSLVKGELLTAEVDTYPVTNIINQGVFVLPLPAESGRARLRIGATYAWDKLDWQTTEAGRSFLETKARQLLTIPFRVVDQQAGIRPSTKDRRPFVGWHPTHPAIGIFGGMGTKGVSLAPYLAHNLANHLTVGEEIEPAVQITRFQAL